MSVKFNPLSGQFDLVGSGASIGGVVSGGTEASVLFVGPGSTLAQDNAHFFWDDSANTLHLHNGTTGLQVQDASDTGIVVNVLTGDNSGIFVQDFSPAGGVGIGFYSYSDFHTATWTQASASGIALLSQGKSRFSEPTALASFDLDIDVNGIATFNGAGSTPRFSFLDPIWATLTTEQMRVGYDASNYFTTTVGSTGITTFDAVGSAHAFVFSDPVTVTSFTDSALTSGRVTFAGTGGALTDSANFTFATAQLTLGVANTTAGTLRFFMASGVQSITLSPPGSIGGSYTITLPTSVSSAGVWINSGSGSTSFAAQLAISMGGTNASAYGASRIIFMNSGNTAFSSDASLTFATPKLQLVAATTAGASTNLPAGTAPTSPVAGDLWTDTTQKTFTAFQDGMKQTLSGTIFTQTADKTVTNTTTETTIVGTGVGTLTLPANFFVIGKTISVKMSGVYSTVAVTGDTVTIKVKYGSTVLASKATTALVTGGTNLYWESNVLVTCRTTGATGTVQVSGGVVYQIAGSAIVEDELNNGVAVTTLDTTASALFDVTVTHGTANASNTVTSLVGAFQVLN